MGRMSIREAEVDAGSAELGKIALDPAVFGVKLHPHRDHLIPARQAGVPDLALFVGPSICVLIGGETDNILTADVTGKRWTGKALGSLRGQCLRLGIGEA